MEEKEKVTLSDEIWRRIRGFLPVVRKVMNEPGFSDSDLVNLAMWIGLEQMFTDVIHKDLGVLLDSFKQMNLDNPDYVGNFIVKQMEEEEAKLLAEKWKKDKFYL